MALEGTKADQAARLYVCCGLVEVGTLHDW